MFREHISMSVQSRVVIEIRHHKEGFTINVIRSDDGTKEVRGSWACSSYQGVRRLLGRVVTKMEKSGAGEALGNKEGA